MGDKKAMLGMMKFLLGADEEPKKRAPDGRLVCKNHASQGYCNYPGCRFAHVSAAGVILNPVPGATPVQVDPRVAAAAAAPVGAAGATPGTGGPRAITAVQEVQAVLSLREKVSLAIENSFLDYLGLAKNGGGIPVQVWELPEIVELWTVVSQTTKNPIFRPGPIPGDNYNEVLELVRSLSPESPLEKGGTLGNDASARLTQELLKLTRGCGVQPYPLSVNDDALPAKDTGSVTGVDITTMLSGMKDILKSNNEEIMGIVAKRCEAAERKVETAASTTPARSMFGGSSFAASVFGEADSATKGPSGAGRPMVHARRSSVSPRRPAVVPGFPAGKSGTISDDAPSSKKFAADAKSPATPFGFGGRATFGGLFKGPDSEEEVTAGGAGAQKLREEEQKLQQRQKHLREEEARMREAKSRMEQELRAQKQHLEREKEHYEAELQAKAKQMDAQASELLTRAEQQKAQEERLREQMAHAARVPIPSSPVLSATAQPASPFATGGLTTPTATSRMPLTPPMRPESFSPAHPGEPQGAKPGPAAAKTSAPRVFQRVLRPGGAGSIAMEEDDENEKERKAAEQALEKAKIAAVTDLAKLFGKVDRRPMSPGQLGFIKYHADYPLDGVQKAYMGRQPLSAPDGSLMILDSRMLEGWLLSFTIEDIRAAGDELITLMRYYRRWQKAAERVQWLLKTWGFRWSEVNKKLPMCTALVLIIASSKRTQPAEFLAMDNFTKLGAHNDSDTENDAGDDDEQL